MELLRQPATDLYTATLMFRKPGHLLKVEMEAAQMALSGVEGSLRWMGQTSVTVFSDILCGNITR